MNHQTIKVGLIGLGRAGYGMHLVEILKTEGRFDIVSVCDIDSERQGIFEEKLGHQVRFYNDAAQMVKDPEIELVSVATPTNFHVDHAILGLRAGKSVLIEKPIATCFAEAMTLAEVARQYPGKLFLRHNRRFAAEIHHLQKIIDSGLLGNVFEIRLRFNGFQRRGDWQTIIACGGGLVNNWGPHIIDHALQFLDSQIVKHYSRLRRIAALGDAEDHFNIILEGENGRMVDVEVSGGCAISEPAYTVYGDRGALVSSGDMFHIKYLDPKQILATLRASAETPSLTSNFGSSEILNWIEEDLPLTGGFTCEPWHIWLYIYETIRNQKPFPITLEEGMAVVKLSDMIKRDTKFAGDCRK